MEQRRRQIDQLVTKTRQTFPEVPNVEAPDLRERIANEELVLVDVRTPEEQAVSMIPGAISSTEFESRADELEGSRVITYCTIGYRSSGYARKLLRDGWDVQNLAGSMLAWTHADGELVDSDGNPTKRLHVFGKRWNLAADGYEGIW